MSILLWTLTAVSSFRVTESKALNIFVMALGAQAYTFCLGTFLGIMCLLKVLLMYSPTSPVRVFIPPCHPCLSFHLSTLFYCNFNLYFPDVLGKGLDAGRDWGQREKGTTEDEMAGWHHRLDGHAFE